MRTLLKDLSYGARTLFKNPGSAAIAVVAFSLGIGLCTTMFSIVYGVFFRGLDVPEPDRLVQIVRTNPSKDIPQMSVTQHDYYDWREQQQSFEGLGGYSTGTVNLSGTEGLPGPGVGSIVPSPNDASLYYTFTPPPEADIWLIELPDDAQ